MALRGVGLPVSLAVCVLCTVAMQGCANKAKPVAVKSAVTKQVGIPDINVDNLPQIDGSTSTRPLIGLVKGRAFGLNGELRRLPGSGEYSLQLTFPVETDTKKLAEVQHKLAYFNTSGTHEAYVRLIDYAKAKPSPPNYRSPAKTPADIILVAREPSEDELALAKEKNVELDVRPVALDAFVFIVNAENPVKSLSLDQIRDVFTGKTKQWNDLGGKSEPIAAFTRDRNSGSQELMEKLVMKDKKMIQLTDRVIYTMVDVIDRVATTPSALSYSVYYYEEIMIPNSDVRALAIDGIAPTAKTIADKTYPLTAEVYVVTRKDIPADSPTAKLRDWLLSEEGQELVKQSGYVPVKTISR